MTRTPVGIELETRPVNYRHLTVEPESAPQKQIPVPTADHEPKVNSRHKARPWTVSARQQATENDTGYFT